jgi:hypothetical protein
MAERSEKAETLAKMMVILGKDIAEREGAGDSIDL